MQRAYNLSCIHLYCVEAHFHQQKIFQKFQNFQLQNFISDGEFELIVSANHILQNFLCVEIFFEWKCALDREQYVLLNQAHKSPPTNVCNRILKLMF
jgi:hypothetical protein